MTRSRARTQEVLPPGAHDPGTMPGAGEPGASAGEPGSPAVASGTTTAAWWRRLLGYFIDCLVILAVTGALWTRLVISVVRRVGNTANAFPHGLTPAAQAAYGRVLTQTLGPFLIELIATACLAVTYYWLLTGLWGTTIGKRCLGARVVSARDAPTVGLGAALVRAVVFVVAGWAIALFFLIDNLWLLWDPRRQSLHDKAARTIVVRTSVVGTSAPGPGR